MTEIPMLFLAGLLGSSHCIGMCGGFAVILGLNSPNVWHNAARQSLYSGGRIFTYAFLGLGAGFLGDRVTNESTLWLNVPAILCVLAGLFLIYQGLVSAGVPLWGATVGKTSEAGCLTGSMFKTFLTMPGWRSRFLAGVITGFLPCGLLYGALALAAATRSMIWGPVLMIVFGLGTVPLMVITGVGGSLLSMTARARMFRIAGWCVVLTGALTLARGVGFVTLPGVVETKGCPFCHPDDDSPASTVASNTPEGDHADAVASSTTNPVETTADAEIAAPKQSLPAAGGSQ
ncbi:MAG: sulfite exporter TauE/SafE family protein [Planctomycetaceae bacterium]|nr:sulfite exporter TauE/SafE family protein [Planctomycetaceae bacterium]MCB9952924.1 sulfite exporter TauE/SafE family protein [Planctomycetaceae bacterium]